MLHGIRTEKDRMCGMPIRTECGEREIIQKHEPQLYNAINHIFGDSYEYMRKYKEFAKMMDEKTKGE